MRGKSLTRRFALSAGVLVGFTLSCVSDAVNEPPLNGQLSYAAYAFPKPKAGLSPSNPQRRPTATHTTVHPSTEQMRAWMPDRGRISPRWTTIVIHHSATSRGGARPFDRFHRKRGWDGLGYHFVIGNGTDTPDGFVEVGARWHRQQHGAHCKTRTNYYNEHGIGICLVGDFTETEPSPKQLTSLARLVRFLTDRCGVALERVTTHGAVTGKTECPGTYFRLAELRRSLRAPPTATSMR